MGKKFKTAMNFVGEMLDAKYENDKKVRELTQKLLDKTYGVDYHSAEAIARVLVTQAEITWK